MRKSIILLLTCLVALSSSCTTRDDEGKIILSYTRWGTPAEMESTRELIAQFEKENPGLEVLVDVVSWEQYWQKIKTSAVTDTAQDVWLMSAAYVEQYIEAGHVLDLMQFIEKDPDFNEDDYFPYAFDAYVFVRTGSGLKPGKFGEGPLYAFTRDYNCSVLYYNRDHFDAQGMAYPDDTWTWDNLVAAARKLTIDFDNDGVIDQWGYGGLQYAHFARIIGGAPLDVQNRRSNYSSERVVKAVRFCHDLIHKYRVHPPVTIQVYETGAFVTGKVSMTVSGIWNVRSHGASECLWDIAPIPLDRPGRERAMLGGGVAHSIFAGTDHPEEAWKLVKFLSSEISQRELGKSGTSVPVLKSAARSEDFLAPFDRPRKESYHYIFDSFKGKRSPGGYLKGYHEYTRITRDTLEAVWRGALSPEKACEIIDEKTNAILAEQYKEKE